CRRAGPRTERGPLGLACAPRHEIAAERNRDERNRHRDRDEPGRPEPRGERGARHMILREDDEVGEVRSRKQQRRRVRHEDGAVEEGRLAEPAMPGGMKTTAVSRFSTALTMAVTSKSDTSSVAPPPRTRAARAPTSANNPSRPAVPPTSSSPATS